MDEKHARKPCGICEDSFHPDELEEHINEKHFCIPCDKNLRFLGISEHSKKRASEEMICRLVSVRLWSSLFGGSKLDSRFYHQSLKIFIYFLICEVIWPWIFKNLAWIWKMEYN